MKRLAIITTHPIQYNAPLFKLLTDRRKIAIKVFYTWGESVLVEKYDPGFQQRISWDIPLLDGYDYSFVKNIAKKPGSSHFNGIDNPDLIHQIQCWNADAVLVFGWAFKSHLKSIRYFKGRIPVFFRGDSTLLDDKENGMKQKMRQLFLKWVYSHIDGAFYTGTNNKKYFEKMGLRSSQLFLAPHAVDNNRFIVHNRTTARTEFRRINNIPEDAFLFLFAGKLSEKKDPLLLGEAFEKLQAINCHLLYAGSGNLETELKNKFSTNPLIHFTGFQNQSEMPALYNACDVFVLPSKGPGETWGLAINEAMASGKAVIASDRCGGAIDLIEENKNGFVFKAGSLAALTYTMQQIFECKMQLKHMEAFSLQKIKNFSFENVAEAIENTVAGDFS